MKIVAFLQNMWFKDPARMKRQLETTFKGDREKFIRTWLFWSCLTGKRLRNALGEELCDAIIWEEASPQIGGQSSSAFPADLAHIRAVVDKHEPTVVLAFGKIAGEALKAVYAETRPYPKWKLIFGPHPAARGEVLKKLDLMADEIKAIVSRGPSPFESFVTNNAMEGALLSDG